MKLLQHILLSSILAFPFILFSCEKEEPKKTNCKPSKILFNGKDSLQLEYDQAHRVSKINWYDQNSELVKYRNVSYGSDNKISTLEDYTANNQQRLVVTFTEEEKKIYIDLVRDITARIPVHEPTWVDFNENDPGVTILETMDYAFPDIKHIQTVRIDCLISTTSETLVYSPNSPNGTLEQTSVYHFSEHENPYYNAYHLYPELKELIFFKKNVAKATYVKSDGTIFPQSFQSTILAEDNSRITSLEKLYHGGRKELQGLQYQCN